MPPQSAEEPKPPTPPPSAVLSRGLGLAALPSSQALGAEGRAYTAQLGRLRRAGRFRQVWELLRRMGREEVDELGWGG